MRAQPAASQRPNYAACSGCSLCLLVCPVWQRTRDLALTPHGRAKALQNGCGVSEMAASIDSCTLCGACRPACPEDIDPVDMLLKLRRQSSPPAGLSAAMAAATPVAAAQHASAAQRILLPDSGLSTRPQTLAKIAALLGAKGNLRVAADHGADISLALEAGALITQQRLDNFLAPLRACRSLVVADGLLCRHLAQWLPASNIVSLGEALSSQAQVRGRLRATDLYVIETRAYHADYQRLVKYYDQLRRECGCELNLDLQRIAIPAAARSLSQRLAGTHADDEAQTGWLLQGRKMSRIVAENFEDYRTLARANRCEVVYLVDLMEEASHAHG